MIPTDVIRTTCTRCNGTGRALLRAVYPPPGKRSKPQTIPCVACEQRGYFERSIIKSRGTTVMLWCLSTYRRGNLSGTLYELLTPGERSSMLFRLGFTAVGHNQIFGHGMPAGADR